MENYHIYYIGILYKIKTVYEFLKRVISQSIHSEVIYLIHFE